MSTKRLSATDASLLQIARDYWNRQGNQPPYHADSLESYVLMHLLEGRPEEASRAMERMAPERPETPTRYGLFMQVGLILAAYRYGEQLSAAAHERLRASLRAVADPTSFVYLSGFHFVNDNWPFCASAINVLGGELTGNRDMSVVGLDRLRDYSHRMAGVGAYLARPCGVGSEHNSPTYAAVQIEPMAVLALCSRIPEARVRGRMWRDFVLTDIASHWHADIQQQAGPYARAYQDNVVGGSGTTRLLMHKTWGPVFMDPEVAWQLDHAHDLSFAAVVAATDYQCPAYLRRIALEKPFPYEVRASSAFFCSDAAYAGHMDPQAVDIYSYLTPNWMLGSAGRAYHAQVGQAQSPMVHWRRRTPVKTMKDFGVLYFRYQFDDKTPDQGNAESWTGGQVRTPAHLREDGTIRDIQDGNTVLHLSTPTWYWRRFRSLAQTALVPLYAELEEIYAGGQQVTALPFESPQALTVTLRDSGVGVVLRPLPYTRAGGFTGTRIRRVNNHLVIAWYNYQGPEREFTFHELAHMQHGLIVRVDDCPTTQALHDLAAQVNRATLSDRIEGMMRTALFDDGRLRLEGTYNITYGHWEDRKVNGQPYRSEIFRSPHIHHSNTGQCVVGQSSLTFTPGMALRLLALEEAGVYVVFNYMEQGAAYRLTTPHGEAGSERLGFGRHVWRARNGRLVLAANDTFRRRWQS